MSNGRPWTASDDRTLRKLCAKGMSNANIGLRLMRHKDVIRRRRVELGIGNSYPPALAAMLCRLNARRRMARA